MPKNLQLKSVRGIRDELAQFRGSAGQDDDLTFVIIKVL